MRTFRNTAALVAVIAGLLAIWLSFERRGASAGDTVPIMAPFGSIKLTSPVVAANSESLRKEEMEQFINSFKGHSNYAAIRADYEKFGAPPGERGTNPISLTFVRDGQTNVVRAVAFAAKYYPNEKWNEIPLDDAVSVIIIQKGGGR